MTSFVKGMKLVKLSIERTCTKRTNLQWSWNVSLNTNQVCNRRLGWKICRWRLKVTAGRISRDRLVSQFWQWSPPCPPHHLNLLMVLSLSKKERFWSSAFAPRVAAAWWTTIFLQGWSVTCWDDFYLSRVVPHLIPSSSSSDPPPKETKCIRYSIATVDTNMVRGNFW